MKNSGKVHPGLASIVYKNKVGGNWSQKFIQ